MASRRSAAGPRVSKSVLLYSAFLLVPLYWLVVLSLQPNKASKGALSLLPSPVSLENFAFVFGSPDWVAGYVNAVTYVALNVVITLLVALPAAYAFARFRFLGSEQALFFSLLFRLMPPAIIMIPVVQMFSAAGLIDTHLAVALAHCLFTVPVSIWILEGFVSAVPIELEETAAIDGYTPAAIFFRILLPQIRPGLFVTAFFCFIFSWVELILANALTTVDAKPIGVIMKVVASPVGSVHIGIASAVSVLMLIPGAALAWALRRHLARGFSMGRVT